MTSAKPYGPLGFAWTDLETTGSEADDHIVEIAVVLTDRDLVEIDRYETIVRPGPDTFARIDQIPIVRDMHEKSGLLADLHAHGSQAPTVLEVEHAVCELIDKHLDPAESRQIQIAGGGVSHFDLPVIRRWMPELASKFSYRPMDITQVAQAYADANETTLFGPKRNKRHRALDDILEDLERGRQMWAMLRRLHALLEEPSQPILTGTESLLAGVDITKAFTDASYADTPEATAAMRAVVGSVRESDALAGVTAVASQLANLLARRSGTSVDEVLQGIRRTAVDHTVGVAGQ